MKLVIESAILKYGDVLKRIKEGKAGVVTSRQQQKVQQNRKKIAPTLPEDFTKNIKEL